MYEIPSNRKIEKCIVTKETIANGEPPKIVINNNREVPKKVPVTKRKTSTKKTGTTSA